MGMVAYLAPLTAGQLDELRGEPDSIQELLFPEENTYAPPKGSIDLDKAWHGIHWLLTGDAWGGEPPLAWTIVGGEDIGDDMGYGPARVVTPEQVRQVAAALANFDDAALARNYDPVAMDAQQIYPTIWTRDGEEGLAYLQHYFRILARFYADAAKRGDAVLQWIS